MELVEFVNSLLKRKDWDKVKSEDKEKYHFIVNRYLSKKYPDKAFFLNTKGNDKSDAMDIWFYFLSNEPYPNWFWSKTPTKEKNKVADKDYKLLLNKMRIKSFDLDYLIEHNWDFIKEELAYYKKL